MTGCLLVGASYALLNTQTHAVGAVAAVGAEDSKVLAIDAVVLESWIYEGEDGQRYRCRERSVELIDTRISELDGCQHPFKRLKRIKSLQN